MYGMDLEFVAPLSTGESLSEKDERMAEELRRKNAAEKALSARVTRKQATAVNSRI